MNARQQDLLPIAERIYLRMQAQDTLQRCIQEQSTAPMQEMIDQILVDNPDIDLLCELLADVKNRRAMLEGRRLESREQVVSVFQNGYALDISAYATFGGATPYEQLTSEDLFDHLRGQIDELVQEDVLILEELFVESTSFVRRLARQIRIIDGVIAYIQDWLMAFSVTAVQAAPRGFDQPKPSLLQ